MKTIEVDCPHCSKSHEVDITDDVDEEIGYLNRQVQILKDALFEVTVSVSEAKEGQEPKLKIKY